MNDSTTAAAAGTIDVGGDLTVNRLGFGAMRITGPGVTCVRWTGQGPLCADGSGPEVLVKVERPQRSEDERP
jgi:hypothetical protein